ncbi:MAG: hypothetical protein R3C56_39680 [Pirellulaceae bacterium]
MRAKPQPRSYEAAIAPVAGDTRRRNDGLDTRFASGSLVSAGLRIARPRVSRWLSRAGTTPLGGQLWGIVGLSVTCLPILLAGGLAVSVSLEIWTAWMIGFAATTLAVRSVIAAQKRKSRSIHWAGISTSLVLAALTVSPYSLAIVTLPMLVMS